MTIDTAGSRYRKVGGTASTRRDRSVTDLEVVCLFSALGLVLSAVVLLLTGSHEIFNALALVAY